MLPKLALGLFDSAQAVSRSGMLNNLGLFGFGLASASALQQSEVQRQIDQMRQNTPQWTVNRPTIQNPDLMQPPLQEGEELKEGEEIKQESIAKSRSGRSSNQPSEEDIVQSLGGRSINQPRQNTSQEDVNFSDSSITQLDLQEFLSDDEADETSVLLNELQRNPDPQVQQQILLDLEVRRQVVNDMAVQVGQEQGADDQEQRNNLLDFVQRIPHERLMGIFSMGQKGITFLTSAYTLYLVHKRNFVINQDFKDMKPLYDISYDTYIPVEKILDKPIPAHCRRILFTDEFGRTRSKLICGNVQDKIGQRVYFNN